MKPVVRGEVNTPSGPPPNPNRFACGNLCQGNLLEDESHCETRPQSFAVDFDCQFAEHDRANKKDYFDRC